MRYVLADSDKAVGAGFDPYTHNVVDGKMVITEKGMMQSPNLSGDESERLSQLGGEMFASASELEFYFYKQKMDKI